MRVIGDKNQISEDEFDFMISYVPFPQKSVHSELAQLFFNQYTSHIHVYIPWGKALSLVEKVKVICQGNVKYQGRSFRKNCRCRGISVSKTQLAFLLASDIFISRLDIKAHSFDYLLSQ